MQRDKGRQGADQAVCDVPLLDKQRKGPGYNGVIRTIITGVGVALMSIFGVVTLTMWKCLHSGAATKRLTYEKSSVEVHTLSWQLIMGY